MNASDTLAIVNTTITSLKDNFAAILPVLFPVIVTVAILFGAVYVVLRLAKVRH